MEKKSEVVLLIKEKENLTRVSLHFFFCYFSSLSLLIWEIILFAIIQEFLELQEKCRSLKAMNFYLKDQRFKVNYIAFSQFFSDHNF